MIKHTTIALLLLAACSSSTSPSQSLLVAPDLDASSAPATDAGAPQQQQPREAAPPCSLPPSVAVTETKKLTASWLTMDEDPTRATALVEIEDTSKHLLTVALERMKEIGFFREGFRTGSFDISGTETRAMTCSVCVGLSTTDANYIAISGKVHVDAIESPSSSSSSADAGIRPRGRLAVRLENVRFKIANGLDAQQCESSLASYTFDVELTPDKF